MDEIKLYAKSEQEIESQVLRSPLNRKNRVQEINSYALLIIKYLGEKIKLA